MEDETKEKLMDALYRAWWWLKVYAAEAAVIFAILYAIAMNGGCTNVPETASAGTRKTVEPPDLARDISKIVREMKASGCYTTGVGISYVNPTNYTISVSAKYYEALDTNNHPEGGN